MLTCSASVNPPLPFPYLLAYLTMAGALFAAESQYISPALCTGCHRDIAESFHKTGMGRSFYRLEPGNVVEDFRHRNKFYHALSDRHYELIERDGKYYQRRYQAGPHGSQINVIEKRIDYVLGSGAHSRTYLTRTAEDRLATLPVAWYREGGGSWGMAPGYDRPDHMDFRREITAECIFCHNAYPQVAAAPRGDDSLRFLGPLPEGIDCQRCHGPGSAHLEAATRGASPAAIRTAIVNPSRLAPARQLEICLQCHLQSTSRRLPYAIRRYNREPFSYRPGEPLADFILHFDLVRPKGADFFEVNHAAYRLLESACFQKSNGALLCTTCHDPHRPSSGGDLPRNQSQACQSCHEAKLRTAIAARRHTASQSCVDCHMPKRRAEDATHIVATDHDFSRRLPRRDLLAPIEESPGSEDYSYLGQVRLIYPREGSATPETALYRAVAQVKEGADLEKGIPQLAALLQKYAPARGEFYYELANAYRNAGDIRRALAAYEEARRRDSDFGPGLRNFSDALAAAGRTPEAIALLRAALLRAPGDVRAWNMLGGFYARIQNPREAVQALRRALTQDPELPEIHVNLGVALSELGDRVGAESSQRQAILLAPDLAVAHLNLGALLASGNRTAEARAELEIAAHSRLAEARSAALRLLEALPR